MQTTIYQFHLDFSRGHRFAKVVDLTHLSAFSGILAFVFRYNHADPLDIDRLIKAPIQFGPVPLSAMPATRGKYAWKRLAEQDDTAFDLDSLYFKEYMGNMMANLDWATLSPWYRTKPFDNKFTREQVHYEAVRHLETTIIHHPEGVRQKITMMDIIEAGEKVSDFYDLNSIGNLNLYTQLVNTCYSKSQAEKLLAGFNTYV